MQTTQEKIKGEIYSAKNTEFAAIRSFASQKISELNIVYAKILELSLLTEPEEREMRFAALDEYLLIAERTIKFINGLFNELEIIRSKNNVNSFLKEIDSTFSSYLFTVKSFCNAGHDYTHLIKDFKKYYEIAFSPSAA